MAERNSGQTAPYGQACTHCFKSKCKCVRRLDGDSCERCRRLGKDCVPADSRRRRHVQQKGSGGKILELEGKLDRLVGILESVARSSGVSASLRKALNDDDDDEDPRARSVNIEHEQEEDLGQNPQIVDPATVSFSTSGAVLTGSVSTAAATPLTSTSGHDLLCEARPSPGVNCSCATRPHSFDSSPQDAESCLQMFRSQFLPCFPFIHLAPDLTAQQLLMTRPVLMRAIMAVATPSTQQKLARGAELKRILARAMLLENQSHIDLLLGLLVFIAWSNDQFLNRVGGRKMGSLSRPMVLAMSIVSELHWNKPAGNLNHMAASLLMQSTFPIGDEGGVDQDSLEIQRAVLGCFMLSSFVSSYFGQTEPLQFTPHMEGYLQSLEQNSDTPTDKLLSSQIRLQLLAQSVAYVQSRHGEPNIENEGPESYYFNAAQVQLQALQTSLGRELLREEIVTAHIHYAELTILEAFYPIPSNSHESAPGLKRAHFAWKSLQAAKSFFEVFFARSSRSPASCAGISFTFWAQLSKALVVLFRLSTMSDWNSKEVNLVAILDRLAGTMEHASLQAGEKSSDDQYAHFARLLRSFKQRVGGKMGCEGGTQQAPWVGPAPRGGDTALNDSLDATLMHGVDFETEDWFQDFFGQR